MEETCFLHQVPMKLGLVSSVRMDFVAVIGRCLYVSKIMCDPLEAILSDVGQRKNPVSWDSGSETVVQE